MTKRVGNHCQSVRHEHNKVVTLTRKSSRRTGSSTKWSPPQSLWSDEVCVGELSESGIRRCNATWPFHCWSCRCPPSPHRCAGDWIYSIFRRQLPSRRCLWWAVAQSTWPLWPRQYQSVKAIDRVNVRTWLIILSFLVPQKEFNFFVKLQCQSRSGMESLCFLLVKLIKK